MEDKQDERSMLISTEENSLGIYCGKYTDIYSHSILNSARCGKKGTLQNCLRHRRRRARGDSKTRVKAGFITDFELTRIKYRIDTECWLRERKYLSSECKYITARESSESSRYVVQGVTDRSQKMKTLQRGNYMF